MRVFWRGGVCALALLPALAFAQPIQPDNRLTPGAVDPTATAAAACVPGYARAHRPPLSHEQGMAICVEYGIAPVSGQFELDHRVPVELGGLTVVANLWPEPYFGNWNAHQKDFLENRAHALVCSCAITLHDGQAIFLGDSIAGYERLIGAVPINVAPAAPAPQHPDDTGALGVWTSFRGDNGICGISTAVDSARRITLLYETRKQVASFRFQKDAWDMPVGQLARAAVWTDGTLLFDGIGVVHAHDALDVYFMPDILTRIRGGLATAKVMRIEFPAGTEPVWTLPISGTAQALEQLATCMTDSNKQANTSAAPAPFIRDYGFGDETPNGVIEIPFHRSPDGMILLQVGIDGVPATFMLDSGASGVSIPQGAFERLAREGRVTEDDYRHRVPVTLANGQSEQVRVYRLRQVSIGGHVLYDIEGLIGRPGSSFLLGQKVLERFGKIIIDQRRGVIRLEA
jgi:predicted aspartyl protease